MRSQIMMAAITFIVVGLCPAQETRWVLVWGDEFEGPANTQPDRGKWRYDLGGGGWGNHELQEYTKEPGNVFLDGRGHLVIRAVRTGPGRYTSSRLKTLGLFQFQYGRIEARIRIPRGQGIWPAFWMLGSDIPSVGWPTCGEIDILENIGREPSLIHGTAHGPGYAGGKGITASTALPRNAAFSEDFHLYRVDWSADAIEWFLDGTAYAKLTRSAIPPGTRWVFDHPYFILLNVAVGGDWPGGPDETTSFPQEMVVDWVRVWQPSIPAAGQ